MCYIVVGVYFMEKFVHYLLIYLSLGVIAFIIAIICVVIALRLGGYNWIQISDFI